MTTVYAARGDSSVVKEAGYSPVCPPAITLSVVLLPHATACEIKLRINTEVRHTHMTFDL